MPTIKKTLFTFFSLCLFLFFSCGKGKKGEPNQEQPIKNTKTEVTTIAIDTSSAQLKWKGYKIVKSDLFSHYGTLPIKDGYLEFDNDELVGGKFIADLTRLISLDLENDKDKKEKLENHLKNADFFDAENYPEAKFEITNVQKEGNKIKLLGNLTIKNKTNNIAFYADIQKLGKRFILVVEPFDIDRHLWDINYKSSYKNIFIKDDITLEFSAKTIAIK